MLALQACTVGGPGTVHTVIDQADIDSTQDHTKEQRPCLQCDPVRCKPSSKNWICGMLLTASQCRARSKGYPYLGTRGRMWPEWPCYILLLAIPNSTN